MIFEKIVLTIISIKNLLIINLLICYYKILNQKILIFYHPKDNFKDISDYHINKLLKFPNSKNIKVIILDNSKINFYRINYIKQHFIKYIIGVDLFLNNYVCDTFPKKCQRAYLHHDIYDTPMVNKEIENKLFTELSKLDYIFVSADIVKDYFEKKFVEYSDSKKKNNTKIINTGYLKLDHVCRELKLIKNKQNHILIAPTASKHYQSINLSFHINKIIQFLLQKKYQVIYRPHPMDLTYKGNHKLIKKINQRFKNDDNFFLDISNSYLESYSKSFILITDFSGTAYTYSFSQNKPVIFFSYNENEIIKKELSKLNYFIDRKKIGYIVNNFTVLNQKLKKIQKNNILFGKKIDKLKKIRIKNFGNSLKVTKKTIESML